LLLVVLMVQVMLLRVQVQMQRGTAGRVPASHEQCRPEVTRRNRRTWTVR